MFENNKISATRVKQNNQEFLISIFSISQILKFTKSTERVIEYFDENNYPQYNQRIQRKLEPGRVKKIADFLIDDPDAIFPTNIVLSIPNAAIEKIENVDNLNVVIELNEKVFDEIKKADGDVYLTIIDGQHRIKGIEEAIERIKTDLASLNQVYSPNSKSKLFSTSKNNETEKEIVKKSKQLNNLLNINLIVSFFINPILEFQAMVFSTINRTQKSVPQSLVSSLFGLTEKDTPYKSALEIVLALNAFESSPFLNRIKLHGGDYETKKSPPLTQATMVKSIVELISTNPRELERDRFRERKELLVQCGPTLPFRVYYAKNNDDFITDIIFSFFSAVRQTFSANNVSYWDFEENTKPKNILHTTVGYQALLNLLVYILTKELDDNRRDKIATYNEYLSKCKSLHFDDQQRYPFTSISKTILYMDMHLHIWPPINQNDERVIKRDEALKKRE